MSDNTGCCDPSCSVGKVARNDCPSERFCGVRFVASSNLFGHIPIFHVCCCSKCCFGKVMLFACYPFEMCAVLIETDSKKKYFF